MFSFHGNEMLINIILILLDSILIYNFNSTIQLEWAKIYSDAATRVFSLQHNN